MRTPVAEPPPCSAWARRGMRPEPPMQWSCHAPEQADHTPEDLHVLRADRLHRLVLGLQSDVVVLAEEALDGRLLPHERDDDVAVGRGLLRADHDVVALEH